MVSYVKHTFNELHNCAEVSNHEFTTSQKILNELEKFRVVKIERVSNTGVIGIIEGNNEGPNIAIRSDIDALPYIENGHKIAKHTCGHDAHTAMVLSVVRNTIKKGIKKGKVFLYFNMQKRQEREP